MMRKMLFAAVLSMMWPGAASAAPGMVTAQVLK